SARAAATLWWQRLVSKSNRTALASWIGGFAHLARAFPGARPAAEFRRRIIELVGDPQQAHGSLLADVFPDVTAAMVADYLFDVLTAAPATPVFSSAAVRW